jgi:hypothetical protein
MESDKSPAAGAGRGTLPRDRAGITQKLVISNPESIPQATHIVSAITKR